MLQPKWVLDLKKKASIKKVNVMLTGVFLSIIAAIIGWSYEMICWGLEKYAIETGLIAGGITLGVCWLFGGIWALLSVKVRVRHYNGNVICFYNGLVKGWLFINGELFDEGGMFDYTLYGQLPTGEEVVVKADPRTGSVSFHIGSTTSNQSILLS